VNPYDYLDDPESFNRNEHIGEVLSGGAVAWLSEPPKAKSWSGETLRDRLNLFPKTS